MFAHLETIKRASVCLLLHSDPNMVGRVWKPDLDKIWSNNNRKCNSEVQQRGLKVPVSGAKADRAVLESEEGLKRSEVPQCRNSGRKKLPAARWPK
jgi:hypothetical protein